MTCIVALCLFTIVVITVVVIKYWTLTNQAV
jgi:hypothetical protein